MPLPKIILKTVIHAPREKVFDMSRDMDIHQAGMSEYKEKAVSGKTSGLINLGETVTWRARHLGVFQQLTVKIVEMESPSFFADEMVKGVFDRFRHEHHFKEHESGTLMTDVFDYTSPFGWLGRQVDRFLLIKYMTNLLSKRNKQLKIEAEK